MLRKAGDLWERHAEEIHGWVVRESGAIPPFGPRQTHFAIDRVPRRRRPGDVAVRRDLRTNEPHLSFSRRMPVGVVGVIAPFNAPLILSIRAVAPALALGNAVLLKPDPRTAVCGGVTLARIFEEAGLPAGCSPCCPGGADVGEALVTDPDVRHSRSPARRAPGARWRALAAENSKRVHLELGGKSALIVLDDVDVEKAVSVGAFGSFLHQGQVCMASGRHLVQRKIAGQYIGQPGRARASVADRQPGQGAGGPGPDHRRQAEGPHPRAS